MLCTVLLQHIKGGAHSSCVFVLVSVCRHGLALKMMFYELADPVAVFRDVYMSHGWCQERHPAKIAPVLQKKPHFTVGQIQDIKRHSTYC